MKDKRISQLFDDYANELPQQNSLADKAVAKMKATKSKKASNFFVKLGGVCAALLVCIICLSIFLPTLGGGKNDGVQRPEETLPYKVYAQSDLTGVRVSERSNLNSTLTDGYADVSALFGMRQLDDLFGTDNVSETKYVAYYLSDKSLAKVKATYRVYDSTLEAFCDVTVVAERDGLVQNTYERKYKQASDKYVKCYLTDNGEYVGETKYRGEKGMHFYVFCYGNSIDAVNSACTAVSEIL